MTSHRQFQRSEAQWRADLTDEQYRVLRLKSTEPPFSGRYVDNHESGAYACAACSQLLFESDAKFDSGSGWPSFHSPASKAAVAEVTDRSHGMVRTEAVCSRCGSHLGHVFDDGPPPTGLRYCINSVSLSFEARED